MTKEYDSLTKSWEGHINELIHVTAKKTDKIEQKHQQIVDGALQVFLAKGYHPATIREISEASGMSMGQLYHYVSSKDDVLFLIHRYLQIEFFNHMDKLDPPKEGEDAVESLLKSIHHALSFLVENKKRFQFLYTETKYLNKDHLKVVLQMDDRNIIQYWRDMLKRVKYQTGLDFDVDFHANIIAYLSVFIPMRGWNIKYRPTNELMEMISAFILKGIGVIQEPPAEPEA